MKLKSLPGLILVVIFLAGCESVMTTQLMGETLVQLNPTEWQGTWLEETEPEQELPSRTNAV